MEVEGTQQQQQEQQQQQQEVVVTQGQTTGKTRYVYKEPKSKLTNHKHSNLIIFFLLQEFMIACGSSTSPGSSKRTCAQETTS